MSGADLVLGAWLGGVACYLGILTTPTRTHLPLLPLLALALFWPAAIALAHAGADDTGGRK